MKDLEEIRELLDRRDLDRARALLAPVIRSAPSGASIEDLGTMAALAEELGEQAWAETAYNLILRSSPNRRRAALERLLEEGIDLERDMVRIYSLCGRCRTTIRGIGCCSEGPAGAEAPDEIIDN